MQQLPAMPAATELAIETGRLQLYPMVEAYAEEMFGVLADHALYEYTGEVPPESAESLRKIYASRKTRRSPDGRELWFNWIVRERYTQRAVGYMQASVAATHADVAWVIGSAWQNRGYASEAAQAVAKWLTKVLGVTFLRASIDSRHEASQRVAMKAGFRRTSGISGGEQIWLRVAG